MASEDRTITLLRHGETEWSAAHKHTGRTDLELTPDGEDHARRAGDSLAGERFAHVLCSPLRRATDTCRLAGLGEPELVDDLMEWDYGEAEGRTTAEMAEDVPGWTVWTHPLGQGELVEQVGERADRVVARLEELDGDVAVVAHGHLLRILTARWLELPAVEGRRFVLGTAALCRLGYERGNRVIERWNDTGHMR
ncbi:histidine phosphatase family protein [Aquipuribacter nitratireducens]|uniref:Histidine phosphatase family protein n=1 Tax=Aquipuribacter nitratireducens TaxID=650104 RepID=A0ABW0GMR6_9MICO